MTARLRLSRADSPLVGYRQLVAAPGAAPRQHGTAILSFHTRTKSVFLRAFAIVRLKCAFRHDVYVVAHRPKRPRILVLLDPLQYNKNKNASLNQ